MYLLKHGHCSHAQLEDAPEVLGHASISKWAIRATTEQRTSWSGGGTYELAGKKSYLGIQYIFRRNSTAGLQHTCFAWAGGIFVCAVV
jgi:hypothetical protein